MNFYPAYTYDYWMMETPAGWYSSPPEMICSICSDKAEGYHFGAISCAACGAFFRRSVSDQKVYSCQDRRCNIRHDPTKRGGSCRFCRFSKCVKSGMMPQDVKAKRSVTQQTVTSLYRSMNPSSVILIDQIIGFRRSVAAERVHFETMSTVVTRPTFLPILSQEIENCKRISIGYSILLQITERLSLHPHFHVPPSNVKEDHFHDVFLVMFIFESCYQTSLKGGVQLDRLILPNMMYIDVSENKFMEFFQCEPQANFDTARIAYNAFSYLVQMISRSFQTSNFDESYLSVLFYLIVSEIVPVNFRSQLSEVNRLSLLTDLTRVDPSATSQFEPIIRQIHEGTRMFKEVISHF